MQRPSHQIIKFICDTKQNINESDIIIRQMCRQDTKAVVTALTGALGSKNKLQQQMKGATAFCSMQMTQRLAYRVPEK